jgi:hypothetical protein
MMKKHCVFMLLAAIIVMLTGCGTPRVYYTNSSYTVPAFNTIGYYPYGYYGSLYYPYAYRPNYNYSYINTHFSPYTPVIRNNYIVPHYQYSPIYHGGYHYR